MTTRDAADPEQVRLAVYHAFAESGVAPTRDVVASKLGVGPEDVQKAFERLATDHHLALDAHGTIVMAHPFSAVPLGFVVMGSSTLWWGGCAWDSFALPFLLEVDELLVATRCLGCGKAHAWVVERSAPPEGSQVAHFLVPAQHMWDDVVYTCGNQRIFCSRDCVHAWLGARSLEEGYVMDLHTLWRLASRWYEGRLERGYQRRDPATAAEYMRESGLSGSFWGL